MLLLPGDLDTPSGGYRYDRRLVEGLRGRGWQVDVVSLQGAYPMPDAAARAQAEAAVAALPDDSTVIADGLAFGALAETAERHARRLRWVALVHHPLALETGLAPAQAAALLADERRALAAARRVVVTSEATAGLLGRLAMAPSGARVIEPGCDLPALPQRKATTPNGPAQGPLQLLCVASVTARKGHRVLLEALAPMTHLPWTLHCVGSLTMDPETAAAARAAAAALGLQDRVLWHGATEADALPAHYARADLFVLPSLFEGYGMVLAEALAHGLPVVATDTGAAAPLLGGGAGVLVPPGDTAALRTALAPMLSDSAWRESHRRAALATRDRLPTWPSAWQCWEQVLEASIADRD
ncbi:MAG: glycosyltransferase family 4 protein [Rubrivivax sp.]|nr:glycosyltransferase family 4 protein [Rubrivivax sp.]